MTSADLLADGFGRIRDVVTEVVAGLSAEDLAVRLDDDANSIAWLVWHLTRVQDDHVSDAAGMKQIWLTGGWSVRFALPFDPTATGYGQGPDEAGTVRASAELLLGYFDAVHRRSLAYVRELADADLDRVVDTSWDPPVTLAVRLVSVLSDDLQHAGQAAFIRGVLERR